MNNTNEQIINIMLDLETTGTEPGCCILSIGAVKFLTGELRGAMEQDYRRHYDTVSHNSCLAIGLTDSVSTMLWWDGQDSIARDEAFSGKTNIRAALAKFSAWYKASTADYQPANIRLWCKGAAFDEPILRAAYEVADLSSIYPINYRSIMCYRTLEALYPEIVKTYQRTGTAHSAIDDATNQAGCASLILSYIESNKGGKVNG